MNKETNIFSIRFLEIVYCIYVFTSFSVPMLGWNQLFLQISLYGFILLSLFTLIIRRKKVRFEFSRWYLLFVSICLFSIVYSVSKKTSIEMIPDLITALVLSICFSLFLEYYENALQIIIYSYIITSIIIGLNLITHFSQDHWWSRLGESFGMNENMVALYFLIPICLAIPELFLKKNIILNTTSVVISFIVILLSGSKKALFSILLFGIIFYLCKSNGVLRKIKTILISILAIILVYFLIIKSPLLYNIIGSRIEVMIQTFMNSDFDESGGSTAQRGDMIAHALSFFISSPLLGHGINSFKELYGNMTGHYVYAHNNYAELFADLGLLGGITYYSFHVSRINRIIKMNANERNHYADAISLISILLFFDLAMVTYYDTRILLLLSIITFKMNQPMDSSETSNQHS